jgi:hypothetical protein
MISIISKEIESLKIDKKTLRNFGFTFFIVLSVMGGYVYWRGHSTWPWFLGGGGVFLIFGLFFPLALKPFYKVWMALAFLLGLIMTRFILTLTFFLIITPMGFVLRMLGKDLLDEKVNKDATTYWRKHEAISDKSRYLKQY